jgi:hypothetical protein
MALQYGVQSTGTQTMMSHKIGAFRMVRNSKAVHRQ